MKGEEEEAAGFQNAIHLAESLREISFRDVNNGIEGHDGGPGAVLDVERQHVALLEFEVRVQLARLVEHARREIEAEDVHAATVQVARHMARPATKIADPAGAIDTGGKLVKKHALQRFVFELAGNSGRVFFGDAVVAGLIGREFLRIHRDRRDGVERAVAKIMADISHKLNIVLRWPRFERYAYPKGRRQRRARHCTGRWPTKRRL